MTAEQFFTRYAALSMSDDDQSEMQALGLM
jgi:hypothetical protein